MIRAKRSRTRRKNRRSDHCLAVPFEGMTRERDLFILRGPLTFVRSENGRKFVAQAVRAWVDAVGAKTAYFELGRPWQNGFVDSTNARFRGALLNPENFYSPRKAQIFIEGWRKYYNTKRLHGALGYRPSAPETIVPMDPRPTANDQSHRSSQIRLLNSLFPFSPLQ